MAGTQDNHRFEAHHGPMSDLPPEQPTPAAEPTPTQSMPVENSTDVSGASGAPTGQRFRDRLWGLRAVILVALASVILGGLGGAGLASFGGHEDGRSGPGNHRFQGGGPGGPPGMWRDRGPRGKGWKDKRGMGQRQWGQDGPPADQPTPTSPASPTPSS